MKAFLTELRKKKIELSVQDGKLKINAPKGAMTRDLMDAIKEKKAALFSHIESAKKVTQANISPAPKKDGYPLSSAQSRLYFLHEYDKSSLVYNIPTVLKLDGKIDRDQLQQTFDQLIKRHESLRTTFEVREGTPVQVIHSKVPFVLAERFVSEEKLHDHVKELIRPFDLTKAPILRATLLRIGADQSYLVMDIHHIIADGSSVMILEKELKMLYEGLPVEDLRVHYKDFSEWQNHRHQTKAYLDQERYWLEEFSGELPTLNLPLDYPRPDIQSFRGGFLNFQLSATKTEALRKLGEERGYTTYSLILAIYQVTLSKVANQDLVLVGSQVAGRNRDEIQGVIGNFVNTLIFKSHAQGEKSWTIFLDEVKATVSRGLANQEYKFDKLVEEIVERRDPGRNPIYDAAFVFQNYFGEFMENRDPAWVDESSEDTISKFDIDLECFETKDHFDLTVHYCTDLFERSTISTFIDYFNQIVDHLLTGPEGKLKDIKLISDEASEQLVADWCGEAIEFSSESPITLFEKAVTQNPKNVALIDAGQSISFEELDQKANIIGSYLSEKSVDQETFAVFGGRDVQMVASILGVLKAGKTFLAIDENYPVARIHDMLAISNIQVVLKTGPSSFNEPEPGIRQVVDVSKVLEQGVGQDFRSKPAAKAAYLIFTSGTSGTPKGVVCSNAGLSHYVQSLHRALGILAGDVFLHTATFSFSSAMRQLFLPLCHGNTLVMARKEDIEDPRQLFDLIAERHVAVIDLVPTYLRNCLSVLESANLSEISSKTDLRMLLTASEPLPVTLVKKARKVLGQGLDIVNMYGQTETTGIASTYRITPHDLKKKGLVSIGKPLAGTGFRILDNHGQVVPAGLEGQLCFTGPHLALGYLGEQSHERFIEHEPFQERLYLTGDMVKIKNGLLEYVGRRDGQVKIRGFRIELEEIAAQGQKLPGVQDFLVIPIQQGNEDLLVAYYVSDQEFSFHDLAGPLSESLPDYMIPSYFVRIDQVPLTSNGKIDKKSLPRPDLEGTSTFVSPGNQIEVKLAEIWGEVLGVDPIEISVDRSFFELGGHSLRATVLSNKIHMSLEVELPVKEIFRFQSIIQQARFIEQAEKRAFSSIPVAKEKTYYETSSAQRRLYFLNRMHPDALAYNMPQLLQVEGALQPEQFELAFKKLIDRHEVLRTSFHMVDGVPKQQIHDQVNFQVVYVEDAEHSESDLKSFVKPFDLSAAPLLNVVLIRKSANHHLFLFDIHHIITDGVSQGILIQEIIALFGGDLAPLRIHYKDYAEWQQTPAFQNSIAQQKQYWLQQFKAVPPQLSLPTDYARTHGDDTGAFVSIQIDPDTVRALQQLARTARTTPFVMFISILNVFLSRLCDESDVVVGVPSVSRNHADTNNMVGLFLNTLALRNEVHRQVSFQNLLKTIGDNFLEAHQNQDYQFEELLEQLDLERDLTRNPLFDVFVNYLNFDREEVDEVQGLKFEEVPQREIATKFDLSFYVSEPKESLDIALVYKVQLFKHETISYLCKELKRLIIQVAQSPEINIGSYEFLEPKAVQISRPQIEVPIDFNPFTQAAVDSTISRRFEAQVDQYPNRLAICYEGLRLTYEQLNDKANQLAHHLIGKRSGDHKAVCLLFNMGIDMVASMLAATKTGKVYIPIDPAYPIERIIYTVKDSGATILLANEATIELAQRLQVEIGQMTVIDVGVTIDAPVACDNPQLDTDINDPAYLLYTSGTTGNPKGVIQSHRNVLHFVRVYTNALHLNFEDRLTLLSSYCFDASVMDIYGALLNGATLYPYDLKMHGFASFRQMLQEENITIYHSTPSVFRSAFEITVETADFDKIRMVVMGGEAVKPQDHKLFTRHFGEQTIFVNGLGPTESTVTMQNFIHNKTKLVLDKVPVGYPVEQTEVIIQGKTGQAAVLQAGEIIYKSDYLALGYWNNTEATEKSFLSMLNGHSGRFYRSGDLGKLHPDGTIEFLGRMDRQVKVNGYRVELGEVENQLLTHPSVNQVVATIDEKGKQIIAYYTTNDQEEISNLMAYATEKIAAFMIPRFLIHLPVLPLTPNGKLDKKALPMPELERVTVDWENISKTSHKVLEIWSEILQVSETTISPVSGFFDIGGDSLKLLQLNDHINQAFGLTLEISELFRYPTVIGMADLIDGNVSNQSMEQTAEDEVDGMSDMINLFN